MNAISMNLASILGIEHVTIDGTNFVLAAGTSDVNSGAINYKGCEGLLILCTLGAMAAASTVDAKLQYSADGSTGWTDVAGSAQAQLVNTNDDQLFGWDVKWPVDDYGYLRVAFTRGDGGNSTIENLTALKYGLRVQPQTPAITAGQFAAVANLKTLIGPLAGTA